MSVQIIAESLIEEDHFQSATEQEGAYIGQPVPAAANAGNILLVSKGIDSDNSISDLTYDGTATSNGSTTTIIDSVLTALGNDFLIGATIEFTSGANDGTSVTITDFDNSTGTITWSGAITSTATSDTFTVTIDVDNMDFKIEVLTSGDQGVGTFRWSHDGGTTWFGREDFKADWDGLQEISNTANADCKCRIVRAHSGVWFAIFTDALDDIYFKTSTNMGLTWSSATSISTVGAQAYILSSVFVTSSGRIVIYAKYGSSVDVYYSDDNGATWAGPVTLSHYIEDIAELQNANLIGVYTSSFAVYCKISTDGGLTWGSAVTIANDSGIQQNPTVCIADNGDIVCAYSTDEDATNDYDIKCKISSDNGATWGSVVDIKDYAAADHDHPNLLVDYNGDIYCAFDTGDDTLNVSISTDNGATWGASSQLESTGAQIRHPILSLLDGYLMLCTYNDQAGTDIDCIRNGRWTSGETTLIPDNALAQVLMCDAGIKWLGAGAIDGDIWTFTPQYTYSMKNLISESPDKPWRSENDNAECNIVLDAGANRRAYISGVAFFNCNIKSMNYQMNASDSWGSPQTDDAVSFQLGTGTFGTVLSNTLNISSATFEHKDHSLAGKYIMPTSGTDSGLAFKIKDNIDDIVILELDAGVSHNIAASDTFSVYCTKAAISIGTASYKKRFQRINITAQHTFENYYQIGTMIAGGLTTLSRAWVKGYKKTIKSGVELLRPISGGIVPIERGDDKHAFTVSWSGAEDAYEEAVALFKYLRGRNLALIPDSSNLLDVYCCKLTGDLEANHWFRNRFNFSLNFEEV